MRSYLEILSSTTQSVLDRYWRPDQSTIKYISQVARKKNTVGNQSSIRRSLVDATSRLSWRRGGKQEVMSGGAEETLRDERIWSVVAAKSRQSSTIEERLLGSGLASERKRTLALRQFATSRVTSICLSIRRTSRRYDNLTGFISVISGSSEESRAGGGDPGKLGVKKSRLKASSPNRQGPQQCQVSEDEHARRSVIWKLKSCK